MLDRRRIKSSFFRGDWQGAYPVNSCSATPATFFTRSLLDPRQRVAWRAEILESPPTPSLRSPLSLISLCGHEVLRGR